MEQLRELFASLGWIDVTALLIVTAFALLGLIRGMVWQVGRVFAIVAAYVVAVWFGGSVAGWVRGWLPGESSGEAAQYVAWFVIFLAVLVVSSLLAAAVHRWIQRTPLSPANRIGGAVLGVATGALIVLTLLTGVHLTHGVVGIGGSIAEAASSSRSQSIGDRVLSATGSALPDGWKSVTHEWRVLLRGGETLPGERVGPEGERVEKPGRRPTRGPESRV